MGIMCVSGSHLYGTNLPSSDRDFKCIYVPTLQSLVFGEGIRNKKALPSGKASGDKMSAEEIETEYIPVQTFINDLYGGQTYAYELAFALDSTNGLVWPESEQDDDLLQRLINFCNQMRSQHLFGSTRAMTSYAMTQAEKYGLKSSRYKKLRDAHAFFSSFDRSAVINTLDLSQGLAEGFFKSVAQISKNDKHGIIPGIVVNHLKFPWTVTCGTVVDSLKSNLSSYGERSIVSSSSCADLKAIMHAVRICKQAIEMLETNALVFPVKHAEFLKGIRLGAVSVDEAKAVFEADMDRLIELEDSYSRVDETQRYAKFTELRQEFLFSLYGLQ